MITVVIPVGPFLANKRWLEEALDSVKTQTRKPDEILIIDDMADLSDIYIGGCTYWKSPWRLGVAHAFNFGVALAKNELVFLLGSDDYMEPRCLELCIEEWKTNQKQDGYYYVGVQYLDDREFNKQDVPCGAAMVTKNTWRKTGGFAVESAVGTSDANFVSQMMIHKAVPLIKVANGEILYNYRPHPESDTAYKQPWQGVILQTRDLLTAQWQKPNWGRYE